MSFVVITCHVITVSQFMDELTAEETGMSDGVYDTLENRIRES